MILSEAILILKVSENDTDEFIKNSQVNIIGIKIVEKFYKYIYDRNYKKES